MEGTVHASESVLEVQFSAPGRYSVTKGKSIFLEIPGEHCSAQALGRLQQLREAMELFTLLSFVNHEAFNDLVFSGTVAQPVYFPEWGFRLARSSSSNILQTPVTWGTLLGFSDGHRWEYSPAFLAAVQKLEAMEVARYTETRENERPTIYWTARLGRSAVVGDQKLDEPADLSTSARVQFQRLFGVMVPPIVQLATGRGGSALAAPSSSLRSAENRCESLNAVIRDGADPVVPDLAVALAKTATRHLSLDLEHATINSHQAMVRAGQLLNTLVCGSVAGKCSRERVRELRPMVLWGMRSDVYFSLLGSR